MPAPVFIGDEISAAGYRLAGVQVRVPTRAELPSVLAWAQTHAPLILLSTEYAAMLPPEILERARRRVTPAVVVVPDARGRQPLQDTAQGLRRQLGVLE